MKSEKYFKRWCSLILSAVMCLIFAAGCSNANNTNNTNSPDPSNPTEKPASSYGEMLTYETDFDKLAMPFWRSNIMYNECVTMVKRENGEITAKTLFTPVRIIEVRDVSLNTVYEEGKDYVWNEGTNTLTWLEGSSIAYFTENDLGGKREDGTLIDAFGTTDNPWDEYGRSRLGNALYCVSWFLYEKQIAVTYEYEYKAWQGAITEYQGNLLPKTMEKLNNSDERMKVVFYGDSIFTGCDASSLYNRAPYQDLFSDILIDALKEKYDAKFSVRNPSAGGKDSVWGVENAQELVANESPDLVVIGFGMNDGMRPAAEVAANIQSIMDTVKASNPDCEFIVVSPMVDNPRTGSESTHAELPAAYKALSKEGVAFVDMYTIHSDILETKDYSSTTGNNINHPNDWLIRVYAMNLIACMIDM